MMENQSMDPNPSKYRLSPFSINQITNPANKLIAPIRNHIS